MVNGLAYHGNSLASKRFTPCYPRDFCPENKKELAREYWALDTALDYCEDDSAMERLCEIEEILDPIDLRIIKERWLWRDSLGRFGIVKS